jgi:SOS response regulatory protein OraA/RecX
MKISVLSVTARGEDEIYVTLEIREGDQWQKESFLLSAKAFADLGISVGECDREEYDRISRAAEIYRALKKGLTLLSYSRCSKKALVRKLISKGFSREYAIGASDELVREGYIDEHADALREAEICVSKLWGENRIRATLYEKGYPDDAISAAMYSLEDSGVDFSEICAARLERFVDEIPSDPKEKQKLVASLIRYGFSSSQIRDAIRTKIEKR